MYNSISHFFLMSIKYWAILSHIELIFRHPFRFRLWLMGSFALAVGAVSPSNGSMAVKFGGEEEIPCFLQVWWEWTNLKWEKNRVYCKIWHINGGIEARMDFYGVEMCYQWFLRMTMLFIDVSPPAKRAKGTSSMEVCEWGFSSKAWLIAGG